jgi:hypothetical protein
MFSRASRWALSWSVVFGLCQQGPAAPAGNEQNKGRAAMTERPHQI